MPNPYPAPLPRPDPIPIAPGKVGYPSPFGGGYILPGGHLTPNNAAYYQPGGPGYVAPTPHPSVLGATDQPSTPTNTAPASPNGVAAAGPVIPDKSNDIALQNAGLLAADTQQSTGLAAVQAALAQLLGKYGTEATANEGNYSTQSTTNKQNLQRNKQSTYVNAANGRQGLFGTLASLGALGGSGIQLANNAVQQGANADLAGANDTFGENQTNLDTAIGTFRSQDEARKKDAEAAGTEAQTGVRNQTATSKQKFYSNLADDYAAMNDKVNAKKYADLAASLFPSIASTSIPSTSLAYTPSAFTPSALSSYVGGNTGSQVATTPATPNALPGLVVAPVQKRRQTGV